MASAWSGAAPILIKSIFIDFSKNRRFHLIVQKRKKNSVLAVLLFPDSTFKNIRGVSKMANKSLHFDKCQMTKKTKSLCYRTI